MSPLSHCRVPCLSTDSSPHASPAATPLVSSTRAAGFSGSDWLEVSAWVLLSSSCSTSASHPSSTRVQLSRAVHTASSCLPTGCFPGQLGKASGTQCCSAFIQWLPSSWHNHRLIKQYVHTTWDNFTTSPYLFLKRETGKSESQIPIRND